MSTEQEAINQALRDDSNSVEIIHRGAGYGINIAGRDSGVQWRKFEAAKKAEEVARAAYAAGQASTGRVVTLTKTVVDPSALAHAKRALGWIEKILDSEVKAAKASFLRARAEALGDTLAELKKLQAELEEIKP